MKKKIKKYAEMGWTPDDVKTIRPTWTLENCEEWLQDNERYLIERLIEIGWEAMEALITTEDDERYEDPNSVKIIKSLAKE